MERWKDAWFIFIKDLQNDRLYLIWNVIFMLYASLMLGIFIGTREEVELVMNPMSDFMMLMIVPFTGFFFSRRSFNYIKENSYTQMLRYYRELPISVRTVLRSRLIQLGAAMLLNGILFYGGLYLVTYLMNSNTWDFGAFIVFCFTWTGYSLLINGVFIFCELLMSGKVYLGLTFLLMLVLGVTAIVMNLNGVNLMTFTLESSRRYLVLSPIMWYSLVVGGLGLTYLLSLTRRRLIKRDLA
ncbi:MAG: hypothetical protein E6Y08_15235 [Paenibacillus sp.]|uniref:hypothetical protein n=1 Tax=Paenibacillus sp. TaxID=58172 RepID=UPI00290EF9E1|nr:hypothetical protein [Paenibacillus sp.]MDU4697167.1 hypothetical protein [Paenibacillus sp.]